MLYNITGNMQAKLKEQREKAAETAKQQAMLDSAAGDAADKISNDLDVQAINSDIQQMRRAAMWVALELSANITDNELGDDELPSDRLTALIAGFSAADDDGEEITLDDVAYDIFVANLKDALESLGVDDSTVDAMFSAEGEELEDAIENAAALVESSAPTGDDIDVLVDVFVFGEQEGEDGVLLDSVAVGKTTMKTGKMGKVVYKAVKAIRNGKVKIVNKRVSGKIKLSSKQRAALNKARRKATSGSAVRKRVKSMRKHNTVIG